MRVTPILINGCIFYFPKLNSRYNVKRYLTIFEKKQTIIMSNIMTPEEIDRLLRDRTIDKAIAEEAKDEWLELSTEKQLTILDKINEPIITERKIQEKILRNLEKMEIANKSIKRNVQYFLWVSIISIISTIIVLLF